jgi:hypothetical protein
LLIWNFKVTATGVIKPTNLTIAGEFFSDYMQGTDRILDLQGRGLDVAFNCSENGSESDDGGGLESLDQNQINADGMVSTVTVSRSGVNRYPLGLHDDDDDDFQTRHRLSADNCTRYRWMSEIIKLATMTAPVHGVDAEKFVKDATIETLGLDLQAVDDITVRRCIIHTVREIADTI